MRRLPNRFLAAGFAVALAGHTVPAAAKSGSCADPIVIGTTISTTGRHASPPDRWRELTVAFAKAINDEGGIAVASCGRRLPVQFYIYDDGSMPETAAALFERMASVDGVDVFAGPDRAALGAAAADIAEAHGIPVVMSNIEDPRLFGRGRRYAWGLTVPAPDLGSTSYFDMLGQQTPRAETIAFVAETGRETAAFAKRWHAQAAQAGLRVIAAETFAPDTEDFTPLLLKLRLRSPDVIHIAVASSGAGSLRLIEQMRRLRVRAQDVHHAMLPGAISLAASAAAGNAIEGVTGTIPWYPGVPGPFADLAARVVADAGIDLFDSPGTMSRLSAYLVVVQALERAGAVDREKLRAALYKGVFELPTGRISFNEKGHAGDGSSLALQIQQGRPVVVWPPEISAGRYLYPSPAWN